MLAGCHLTVRKRLIISSEMKITSKHVSFRNRLLNFARLNQADKTFPILSDKRWRLFVNIMEQLISPLKINNDLSNSIVNDNFYAAKRCRLEIK